MITRMSDFADMISLRLLVSVGNQMNLSVVDFLSFSSKTSISIVMVFTSRV